ncbi:MAG: hypothetical protein VYD90_10675 [Pseudomonadota bacterium]|nr:hypothetical protein [Pseudomonadota bacterium]
MPLRLTNNARSSLAAALPASASQAQVGAGSPFPALILEDEWFPVTIGAGQTDIEVCRCTGRVGTTLTLERGAEGTTARDWPAGTPVELRLTAGTIT